MKLESMTVSELAEVRSGGGAPQDPEAFTATGAPFVRAGSLPKLLGGAGEESLEKLESATAAEYGLTLFPTGTVLFAKSGMSATKGYVYQLQRPAYAVNHLAALVPHKADDSAFLVHVLQRFPPTVLIRDPAYPSIRLGDIENMKVLAPSDPVDRRRIVEVLNKAEALQAKRRVALAQIDTLTQAIFLEMFGDPVTNPKGWPAKTLGELGAGKGSIVDGPFGSSINVNEDYLEDGEIPVIRIQNVRPFQFVFEDLKFISRAKFHGLERSSVVPGDIILTKVGTIGNVCFFPPDFEVGLLSTTGSCRIRPNESIVRRMYLAHFLHRYRREMMKFIAKGVQPFLNMSHIKSFKILLPPLDLQDEFARRISAAEKLEAAQRASLADMDSLFASLQHRAFRGEL